MNWEDSIAVTKMDDIQQPLTQQRNYYQYKK